MVANVQPLRRPECWAFQPNPVDMLAVKILLPGKGSMRALQLPLPAQRQLQLTSRAAGRHLRGRLFLVTSFGEAKEVTRLPGRTPAWSSGRTYALLHPPAGGSREAGFACATVALRKALLLR